MHDPLLIAGRSFQSRLIVGSGKYKSVEETERAVDASGAQIVTVAVRRIDLGDRSVGSLMSLLQRRGEGLVEGVAMQFALALAPFFPVAG